jgi:hypothetical protein
MEKIAQCACVAGGALSGFIATAAAFGSPWSASAMVVAFMMAAAVLAALVGGALGGFVYWLFAATFKLMNRAVDAWESRALEPYRRQALPRAQLVKS